MALNVKWAKSLEKIPVLWRLAMKTEISSGRSCNLWGENGFETCGIWEDAGFTPPPLYMHLTECLHLAFSGGQKITKNYLNEVANTVNSPEFLDAVGFEINDRDRMYVFAKNIGLDVLPGNDLLIAAGITKSIILDYTLAENNALLKMASYFHDENELLEEYSPLKV